MPTDAERRDRLDDEEARSAYAQANTPPASIATAVPGSFAPGTPGSAANWPEPTALQLRGYENRMKMAAIMAGRRLPVTNIGSGIHSAANDLAAGWYMKQLKDEENRIGAQYQASQPPPIGAPPVAAGRAAGNPAATATNYAPQFENSIYPRTYDDITGDSAPIPLFGQKRFTDASDGGADADQTAAADTGDELVPAPYQVASLGDVAPPRGSQAMVEQGPAAAGTAPVDLPPNPPNETNIQPMPERVAQNAPAIPYTSGFTPGAATTRPPTSLGRTPSAPLKLYNEPTPPRMAPPSGMELAGMNAISRSLGNPDIIARWTPYINYGADQRKQDYDQKLKYFEGVLKPQWEAQQLREGKRPETELALQKGERELPAVPSPAAAPATTLEAYNKNRQREQTNGIPPPPPVPPGIAPKAFEATQIKEVAAANTNYENIPPAVKEALQVINDIRNHPGYEGGLGVGGLIAGKVAGSKELAFQDLVAQAKGKAFLSVYQLLRGAGAITEKEGEQGVVSTARLNTAQHPKDFARALDDLDQSLRTSLEKIERRAHQPVTAWRLPGDNSSYAPAIGERQQYGGQTHEYVGGNYRQPNSWKIVR